MLSPCTTALPNCISERYLQTSREAAKSLLPPRAVRPLSYCSCEGTAAPALKPAGESGCEEHWPVILGAGVSHVTLPWMPTADLESNEYSSWDHLLPRLPGRAVSSREKLSLQRKPRSAGCYCPYGGFLEKDSVFIPYRHVPSPACFFPGFIEILLVYNICKFKAYSVKM